MHKYHKLHAYSSSSSTRTWYCTWYMLQYYFIIVHDRYYLASSSTCSRTVRTVHVRLLAMLYVRPNDDAFFK